jgi:hypothetical protein
MIGAFVVVMLASARATAPPAADEGIPPHLVDGRTGWPPRPRHDGGSFPAPPAEGGLGGMPDTSPWL